MSGASIVLAISAVVLGRSSEQAVIKRSDESIRLQTEVFMKTNEALLRIESSTGVTEKRLEDMIAGRTGDLTRTITEEATDEGKSGYIEIDKLDEIIKSSLSKTLASRDAGVDSKEETEKRLKLREKIKDERTKYINHHNELMYGIANLSDTTIEKMGHGSPSLTTSGIEGYDSVFVKNGIRFAVSTFRPTDNRQYADMGEIINNLSKPLTELNIDRLYLILFEKTDEDEPVIRAKNAISMLKDEYSNKLKLVAIPYSQSLEWPKSLEI